MPSPSRGTGRKAIDREKAWLAVNALAANASALLLDR